LKIQPLAEDRMHFFPLLQAAEDLRILIDIILLETAVGR
jgi:hypothetical protein